MKLLTRAEVATLKKKHVCVTINCVTCRALRTIDEYICAFWISFAGLAILALVLGAEIGFSK